MKSLPPVMVTWTVSIESLLLSVMVTDVGQGDLAGIEEVEVGVDDSITEAAPQHRRLRC